MMVLTLLKAFVMLIMGAAAFYVGKFLQGQGELVVCMSSWGAGKTFYDWFPFLLLCAALIATFKMLNPSKPKPYGMQQPSLMSRIGGIFGGGNE